MATVLTVLLSGDAATLTLEDENGEILVYINIPPSVVQGEVIVNIHTNRSESGIVSNIISVDLEDGEGNSLQPDGPLELCFYVQEDRVEKLRLASFDDRDECWQKEDHVEVRERRINSRGEEEILVCGQTDHFTDFSILLNGGDAEVCDGGDGDTDTLLIILSAVGIVASALVVAVIVVSYYYCKSFRHTLQGGEANRVEQLREHTRRGRGNTETEPVENSSLV